MMLHTHRAVEQLLRRLRPTTVQLLKIVAEMLLSGNKNRNNDNTTTQKGVIQLYKNNRRMLCNGNLATSE